MEKFEEVNWETTKLSLEFKLGVGRIRDPTIFAPSNRHTLLGNICLYKKDRSHINMNFQDKKTLDL